MRRRAGWLAVVGALLCATASAQNGRSWLAGDHHVHSRFSGTYPDPTRIGDITSYAVGTDGIYPIPVNAAMARKYGLAWMVATDHGGPDLSRLHAEQSYAELVQSRRDVPEVVQFFGLELNTPGGEHASLVMPMTPDERQRLQAIESAFDAKEIYPPDPARRSNDKMLEALRFMDGMPIKPLVFANHPSRGSQVVGDADGGHTPADLRSWNDIAPDIAVGMEGAPGHQASGLKPGATQETLRGRGLYSNLPTYGGFDVMTATLGGVWDAMLGEGRRWWITANSDSHRNTADGGEDFWPGQYSKTYVYARRDPADILDGLRNGRVFVTTGDLISGLDLVASVGGSQAVMGQTLQIRARRDVTVTIRLRQPSANAAGHRPHVTRVDLIMGRVTGPSHDPSNLTNPTTQVVRRFTTKEWTRRGQVLSMRFTVKHVDADSYVRVRGTNMNELEPQPDPKDENPWDDLWFYSSPIFLKVLRNGHP